MTRAVTAVTRARWAPTGRGAAWTLPAAPTGGGARHDAKGFPDGNPAFAVGGHVESFVPEGGQVVFGY